ncbi:thioesterase family protein [Zhongshania sp.]|uniref:thioesterase family protein n=1 Tax=Zhongshania sp. TaxID=1971902 RepID=UPI003562A3D9
MPRKTIELPERFLFTTEYVVLYSDVNVANHLGADRIPSIAIEAQLRFIIALGYEHATAFEEAGLIMAHSEISYLSETDYADRLAIDVTACNFTDKSFDLLFRLRNLSKKTETARVRNTMLFFDYTGKSVCPVPENFKAKVAKM